MKKLKKILTWLSVLSICISAGNFTDISVSHVSAAYDSVTTADTDSELAEYSRQVAELVNEERARQGLSALTYNYTLNKAASKRATELIELFDHARPDGRDCNTVFGEYGISTMGYGENIAQTYPSSTTPPEYVVNKWLNSEGHRANILNPSFTNIGVGVAYYNGSYYWVQTFSYDADVSEDVNWNIDTQGVLTVNGTGDMPRHLSLFSMRSSVTKTIIGENVKSMNCYELSRCPNLSEIIILNPDCEINNTIYETSASIIYGYSSSTAQKYAQDYNKSFVVIDSNNPYKTTTTTTTTTTTMSTTTATTTITTSPITNEYGTPDNGFSDSEIANSPYKPTLSVDKIVLSYEEAKAISQYGGTIPVNISVSGAENAYSSTGIHVNLYPSWYGSTPNIALYRTGTPKISNGNAIQYLSTIRKSNGDSDVFLTTSGEADYGKDGVMYTIEIELPENIHGGETFPIKIEYQSAENAKDLFTNKVNNETGKLMQAWIFTRGIENGYIQIEEPIITTTITTTTTRTTTTKETTTPTTTVTTSVGNYEQWTMFEDTIVSIDDDKVTFAERGKTAVMNNGSNMEKIKNAGIGSKVSVEALVSPSGSILNIISIEVIEKPDATTGDANDDKIVNIADAVLIMQSLSNADQYEISENCKTAVDVVDHGNGITAMDALAIQMVEAKIISLEDLPTTTEQINRLQ